MLVNVNVNYVNSGTKPLADKWIPSFSTIMTQSIHPQICKRIITISKRFSQTPNQKRVKGQWGGLKRAVHTTCLVDLEGFCKNKRLSPKKNECCNKFKVFEHNVPLRVHIFIQLGYFAFFSICQPKRFQFTFHLNCLNYSLHWWTKFWHDLSCSNLFF